MSTPAERIFSPYPQSSFISGNKNALKAPLVFNCPDLWRNKTPLLDTLDDLYGERSLDSFGGSYGWSVRYKQIEDYEAIGIHTLGEYLTAFRAGNMQLPYLRHLSLNRAMPELRKHIQHPAEFEPNWVSHPWLDRLGGPEIFIGQKNTVFGHVHQDQANVHVGFVQLQGEKEFIVFPPGDGKYLSIFPGKEFPYQHRNSQVHYNDLENHEKFPLLKKARPQRIVLRSGQALLLPENWWHTTHNLSDSISYSIRIINSSNALRSSASHLCGIPSWLRRLTHLS